MNATLGLSAVLDGHILTERNRCKATIGRQSAIKLLHKTATTHFEPIKTTQNTHFLWFLRKLLISLTRQRGRTQVAQTEPKKTQ
jgi:hypothetical protein